MSGLARVVLVIVTLAGELPLTCADRAASLQQIGRARLSELEQAEDAAWGTLRAALGQCSSIPGRCESARADFDAELARARAAIEQRYRRIRDEFEAGCRSPLT
jgi:hypothetical protein